MGNAGFVGDTSHMFRRVWTSTLGAIMMCRKKKTHERGAMVAFDNATFLEIETS
jgi:hypothetical protein